VKRIIRFLAKLYPAPWRARYGAEFDQLVEDSRTGWGDAANVVTGALKMQFTKWGYGRFAMAGVLIGMIGSAVIAFSIPDWWRSESVLVGNADPASLEAVARAEQMMLSRGSLVHLIQIHDLYKGTRNRQPMDVTIQEFRDHIAFTPRGIPGEFAISFEYPDRQKAQSVVSSLMQGVGQGSSIRIEPIDMPSYPSNPYYPRRPAIIGSGLLAGMLAGLAFAWFLHRRQHSTTCPICGHRVPAPRGDLQGA
jgi:hypothetical protein